MIVVKSPVCTSSPCGAESHEDRLHGAQPAPEPDDALPDVIAAGLYEAMHGGWLNVGSVQWGPLELGVDSQALLGLLEQAVGSDCGSQGDDGSADFDRIAQSYRDHYGRDLRADIEHELKDSGDRLLARRLIESGRPGEASSCAPAAASAMGPTEQLPGATSVTGDGVRADEDARWLEGHLRAMSIGYGHVDPVVSLLERSSMMQLQALKQNYLDLTGQALDQSFEQVLRGAHRDLAQALLRGDGVSADAARLRSMVDGFMAPVFSDKSAIETVLEGKTQEQIGLISAEYQNLYDSTLSADMERLIGADRFYALLHLEGIPTTAQETVERLSTVREFERGGFNAPGAWLMDRFNDHGEHLDRNVAEAASLLAAAQSDGAVSDLERSDILRHAGFANSDLVMYNEARTQLASDAGAAGAVVGSVAAITLTAGAASPLVIAASAGAAGGAGRVTGSVIVAGSHYDARDLFSDAASGMVEGAVSGAGATVFIGAAGAAVSRIPGIAAHPVVRTVVTDALEGGMEGFAGQAVMGGLQIAADEHTWQDGPALGLWRVANAAGEPALTGAFMGGLTGGFGGVLAATVTDVRFTSPPPLAVRQELLVADTPAARRDPTPDWATIGNWPFRLIPGASRGELLRAIWDYPVVALVAKPGHNPPRSPQAVSDIATRIKTSGYLPDPNPRTSPEITVYVDRRGQPRFIDVTGGHHRFLAQLEAKMTAEDLPLDRIGEITMGQLDLSDLQIHVIRLGGQQPAPARLPAAAIPFAKIRSWPSLQHGAEGSIPVMGVDELPQSARGGLLEVMVRARQVLIRKDKGNARDELLLPAAPNQRMGSSANLGQISRALRDPTQPQVAIWRVTGEIPNAQVVRSFQDQGLAEILFVPAPGADMRSLALTVLGLNDELRETGATIGVNLYVGPVPYGEYVGYFGADSFPRRIRQIYGTTARVVDVSPLPASE